MNIKQQKEADFTFTFTFSFIRLIVYICNWKMKNESGISMRFIVIITGRNFSITDNTPGVRLSGDRGSTPRGSTFLYFFIFRFII